MTNKRFSKKFNAQRAARAALGNPNAEDGKEFTTHKDADGQWFAQLKAADGITPHKVRSLTLEQLQPGGKVVDLAAKRAAKKNVAAAPEAKRTPKEKPARTIKAKGAEKPLSSHARKEAERESSRQGTIPEPPVMTEDKHRHYAKALIPVVAMVKARDLDGLIAHDMQPKSSSRKIICHYRDCAIRALQVQLGRSDEPPMTEQTREEWEGRRIKEATEYTATKKIRRGNQDTRRGFTTLEQAIECAEKELGRGAIVYAITGKGRSVMVGGVHEQGFEYTAEAKTALGTK